MRPLFPAGKKDGRLRERVDCMLRGEANKKSK